MKFLKKHFLKFTSKKTQWKIATALVDDIFNINTNIDFSIDNSIYDKAKFTADPFLFRNDNEIYLFFEIKEDKGVIGVSKLENNNWKFLDVVLREDFHLSFPKVYKVNNEIFLIPETNAINEVRIYKAKKFPFKWEYYKTLLKDKKFTDPIIVKWNDLFYLFVMQNWSLEIYYSKDFLGEYKPHKKNPFYKNNKKFSRSAGDFIIENNLFRVVQDCHRFYGEKVYLMKIEKLNPDEFIEKQYKLFLSPSNKKWNIRKIHHFSYLKLDNKYLIAFDGEGYE